MAEGSLIRRGEQIDRCPKSGLVEEIENAWGRGGHDGVTLTTEYSTEQMVVQHTGKNCSVAKANFAQRVS